MILHEGHPFRELGYGSSLLNVQFCSSWLTKRTWEHLTWHCNIELHFVGLGKAGPYREYLIENLQYTFAMYFLWQIGYIMSCGYNVENLAQHSTVPLWCKAKHEKQNLNEKQEMLVSGQTESRGTLFIIITFFFDLQLQEITKWQGRSGLYCILENWV